MLRHRPDRTSPFYAATVAASSEISDYLRCGSTNLNSGAAARGVQLLRKARTSRCATHRHSSAAVAGGSCASSCLMAAASPTEGPPMRSSAMRSASSIAAAIRINFDVGCAAPPRGPILFEAKCAPLWREWLEPGRSANFAPARLLSRRTTATVIHYFRPLHPARITPDRRPPPQGSRS